MKTAIKLVLIYFLMQLIGALFAGPFCLLYTYFAYGTFDMDKAGQIAVAPTMLLGFVFMGLYLWRKNYLTGDKHLYSPVSVPYLAWIKRSRKKRRGEKNKRTSEKEEKENQPY